MQLLSLLCVSGFVCPSHMCHIYLLRHLFPWQCFLALGGSVTHRWALSWWGGGGGQRCCWKRPVPSHRYPSAAFCTVSLHLECNTVPGQSVTDPAGTQPPEATFFLINCISYTWWGDCKPKGESSLVSTVVLVQDGGTGKCLLSAWDNLVVLQRLRWEQWQKHQSEWGGRANPIKFCLLK